MASQESAGSDGTNQLAKTTPKDALVMAAILKEMGVTEFEPRIINQMVEFAYRYVTDVVEDARVYSSHANRKNVNIDDIKLAVSQKLDHSFTSPPPREEHYNQIFLLDIARNKNSLPLPLISDRSGIRLPPERYCLTSNNYKVKSTTKKASQVTQRKQSTAGPNKNAKISSIPGNITTQRIQQQQNLSQVPNTNLRAPHQELISNTAGYMQQFPTMLKRKHEGDDDYDT